MAEAFILVSALAGLVGTVASVRSQAATSDFNTAVLEQTARQREAQAAVDAETQALRDRRLMAAQRARFGASGVSLSSGSALNLLSATAGQAERDRVRILAGGAFEGAQVRTESQAQQLQSRSQRLGTLIGGTADFIGGAGRAYSEYTR